MTSIRFECPAAAGRRIAPVAVLVTALLAGHAGAQQPNAVALPASATAQQARHAAALERYEVGHYQAAFAAFAQLADEGHCEAARIAQQMVRFGRELYASEFAAAPARLARWRSLAHCGAALAAR
jgi:hypothetical protein